MSVASLPPLREDLRLHESAPDRDGAPLWRIQDPVTNRFYSIGWLEFECLRRWPGSPRDIAEGIAGDTTLAATPAQVERFAAFLAQHDLLRPTPALRERLKARLRRPDWRHWSWWLHHYLFFRIPLVRPGRFLGRILPWAGPLFGPAGMWLALVMGLVGLVLVSRRWDAFTHGVMGMLNPSGIGGFALSIILAKTLHELGHALTAARHGVRVAHMGVAFVVMWPMLYTDTSETWRLRSPAQRLAISASGILVEIGLAGLATLLWALLDDGPARQAALYLATTGWTLSLALNASPFTRFDGYFILSDLFDFPNLHERSGALARTWLRRALPGLDEPWPEDFSPRTRSLLIAFALATWAYRLVLFVGIALAVYHMFFKALGMLLFAVEIGVFVLMPVWREARAWWLRREEVSARRGRLLRLCAGLALALLAFPWAWPVRGPAAAHPERQQIVFAPFAAQLVSLRQTGAVRAGEPLARFEAPDLDAKARKVQASAQALDHRLAGLLAAEGSQGVEQQQAAQESFGVLLAEQRAIVEEDQRLSVAAEFDGVWLDVDPTLKPGGWVGPRGQIGVLIDPQRWVADVYVPQAGVERVKPGASATFWAEGSPWGMAATVLSVDTARTRKLPQAMLDAQHGGAVATQADPGAGPGARIPVEAIYRVRLALAAPPPRQQQVRGRASIEGARHSLVWEGTKRALAVAIRELEL